MDLHSLMDGISLWRLDISHYTTNSSSKHEALLDASVLYKNLETNLLFKDLGFQIGKQRGKT